MADLFEEPKKKSGDALALALATLVGNGGAGNASTGLEPGAGLSASQLYQLLTSGSSAGGGMDAVSGVSSVGDTGGAAEASHGGLTEGTGKLSGGMSLGLTGLGMLNAGLGVLGLGSPIAGLGLSAFNLSSALLAEPYTQNPSYYTGITAQDVRFAEDAYGAYAAQAAQNQLDAEQGQAAATATGINAGAQYGGSGYMGGGGVAGMGGNDPGSGLGPGAGDPGGSGGMNEALGGVVHAMHPMQVTFGEPSTGGETGIFIPQWMKHPGIQGREADVRSALQRALTQLKGRRYGHVV